MSLLISQKMDRQLLHLNESAHAVYIEASDKKVGDAWTRWARNFGRCLPLTMWEHFGKPLNSDTWERDGNRATSELVVIANALNQGRVVIFPGAEYETALAYLEQTSPKLHERLSRTIEGLIKI